MRSAGSRTQASPRLPGGRNPAILSMGVRPKEEAELAVVVQCSLHVFQGDVHPVLVVSLLARPLQEAGHQVLENASEENRGE